MRYAFILGRNPALASAEISAVFDLFKIDFEIESAQEEFAIFSAKKALDPDFFQKRLGGAIKKNPDRKSTRLNSSHTR